MRKFRLAAVVGLAAASLMGLSSAYADPKGAVPSRCFNSRDWRGWTVSADARSMYIRAGGRGLYRLDFVNACRAAQSGGVHLVTRVRGGAFVCGPLDLDLKVSDGHGMASPCIISKITPLSADEAAALPKALRP
jgi:hypothetical protein